MNEEIEVHNGSLGAWISAEILYNEKLKALDKLLYAIIFNLSHKSGFCWASNTYLAKQLNISKSTVKRSLAILEEEGFLNKVIKINNITNEIEERLLYPLTNAVKNEPTPGFKNEPTPGFKNEPTPGFKNEPYNKQVYNKTSIEVNNNTTTEVVGAKKEVLTEKNAVEINKPKGELNNTKANLNEIIGAWLNKYPDWVIRPVDGAKLKSILAQLKHYAPEKEVELFSVILDNLPAFYKNKGPAVIDSKLQEIIHELKSLGEKTTQKENYSNIILNKPKF